MVNPHTIILKGRPERREENAGGAITPGHLLKYASDGDFEVHSSAGGRAAPIFAGENELFGGDIDDAYASGDRVLGWHCAPGDEVYALVPAAAAAIVIGDYLESNGDGTLRKQASGAVSVATGAVTDDDDAASNGTLVYVHVDEKTEFGLPVAHLESVTAGNANTDFDIGLAGPTIRVNDDDAALTGGLQLYFDEDAANPDERFMFISPDGKDRFVIAETGQAIRLVHNADAATDGVVVYIDDNGTDEELRLLFISPTNADGSYQTDDQVGLALPGAIQPVAEASEAVNNSGGATPARLRVRVL
jgi:hypothetical protein